MASFLYGLTLPFRAFGLILRSPVLMLWSSIPVAITLALYVLLINRMQRAAHDWIAGYLQSHGIGSESLLAGLAMALAWILLIFVSAITFSFTANLVATPFNDFLAEKAERRTSPPLAEVPSIHLRGRVRLLLVDLTKTLASAGLSLVALTLTWIPGLNLLAMILFCLLVTFQFISYPQTRRGEGLSEAIRFILNHPLASLGFGTTLTLLFAIPLISCIAVPLAVVGGTQLYARARASKALPKLR